VTVTITLHGIKNCDSVKKARRWLDSRSVSYQFNDVREDGIATNQIDSWLGHCDANSLVNRRSTSWKNLAASEQDAINQLLEQLADEEADASSRKNAIAQLAERLATSPLLIKRPVVALDKKTVLIGFSEKQYESAID